MKKALVFSMIGVLLMVSPTRAEMTCADFAQKAMEQKGMNWKDAMAGTAVIAGAAAGFGTGILVGRQIWTEGGFVQNAVVLTILVGGVALGATAVYYSVQTVTGNMKDVVDLSDEAIIGQGATIGALANTIILKMSADQRALYGHDLKKAVVRQIATVLQADPSICLRTNATEIFTLIADRVIAGL